MLPRSYGTYCYWRRTRRDFRLTEVHVYVMVAGRELKRWKEKGERERRWFDVLAAADNVLEPELSTLVIDIALNDRVQRALEKKSKPNEGGEAAKTPYIDPPSA